MVDQADDKPVALVCARANNKPLMFPDNITGRCAECKVLVQYRPHAVMDKLICVSCFESMIEDAPNEVEIEVTQETVDEVIAYNRRKYQ